MLYNRSLYVDGVIFPNMGNRTQLIPGRIAHFYTGLEEEKSVSPKWRLQTICCNWILSLSYWTFWTEYCYYLVNELNIVIILLNGFDDNTGVHFIRFSHFSWPFHAGLGKIRSKLGKYPPVLSPKPSIRYLFCLLYIHLI